jgi:hypothetical protein
VPYGFVTLNCLIIYLAGTTLRTFSASVYRGHSYPAAPLPGVDVVTEVEDVFSGDLFSKDVFSYVTVLTRTFFPTPRGRFYLLTFFARTFLPKDVFTGDVFSGDVFSTPTSLGFRDELLTCNQRLFMCIALIIHSA